MNSQCSHSIYRTRGVKTATRRKQRGNKSFIDLQKKNYRDSTDSRFASGIISPARFNACSKEFFTAGIFFFKIPRRGIRIKLQGRMESCPINRMDSLSNLLARFRFTARVSNLLLHIIPKRQSSTCSGTHNIVKRPDDSHCPICFTLSNSLRQRRLSNGFTGVASCKNTLLECQAFTTLCTTAFQHQTASTGLHSFSESACTETFNLGRLIRSLHFLLPFSSILPVKIRIFPIFFLFQAGDIFRLLCSN